MSNGGMVDSRRGAILLIMSAAIFTADVTALRYLSPDVPFVLIIFFRSLLQLLMVTAYIRKHSRKQELGRMKGGARGRKQIARSEREASHESKTRAER